MSRILLTPFAGPGHVVPFATLAAALRSAGHETLMYLDETSAAAADCGATHPPACWRPGATLPAALMTGGDSAEVYRFMFIGPVVALTRELTAVVAQWEADLVIGDMFAPAGGLAAQCAGLPWLSLCCSPVPDLAAYRSFVPAGAVSNFDAATTLAALGLPARPGENLLGRISPTGHVILSTARFAGAARLPDEVYLVGPLAAAPACNPARHRPRDRPEVLVTTTTNTDATLRARAFAQRRYLGTVVAALAELPVRATVTLPAGQDWDAATPDNIRFLGPTPHEELLDQADAVVCHAGWGTVGRALVRGLPLVLVPMVGDQFPIADRCVELGLGIRLEADTMDPAAVGTAVQQVCQDARYRAVAAEFADDARISAASTECVSIVESTLARKR